MKLLYPILTLCLLSAFAIADYSKSELLTFTKEAIQQAGKDLQKITQDAFKLGAQTRVLNNKCPFSEQKSNPVSKEMAQISQKFEIAQKILVNEKGIAPEVALRLLTRQLPAACQQPQTNCAPNSKYRTIDGTCNNLRNPLWGAINQPLQRLLPPAYEDGFDEPRGGRTRFRLPNARVVSNTMHPDANIPNPSITHMLPIFGQFVDHDISLTPEEGRLCCTSERNNPDCWAIQVPFDDPFYRQHGQTCLDFTRSTPFCFRQNGVREQMNANTAFIDGSMIYGSDVNRMRALRTFQGGRLVAQTQLSGFLPRSQALGRNFATMGTFAAGDNRVNENPGLTALHNVFLMEHNRIASQIQSMRRQWSDEAIFQETRRIVIAEFQNIIYNEYLPVVLGPTAMRNYNLGLGRSSYDISINPTIINSFATAAYRFGHSLINSVFNLVSNGRSVGSFLLRDNFMPGGSQQLTQANGQGYDFTLEGMTTQSMQEMDPFVTNDLRNFLFKPANASFGSDLIARNIQRGRDHGLPPYSDFRQFCKLPPLGSWDDRPPPEIRRDAWDRLRDFGIRFRFSPRDVDLFTGGLIEIPVNGGITGPTFNCIKALQFNYLRWGDRFFFTHGGQAGSFNDAQLNNLRSRTLGDIICENSQQLSTQRFVLLTQSGSNPRIGCGDRSRSQISLQLFV